VVAPLLGRLLDGRSGAGRLALAAAMALRAALAALTVARTQSLLLYPLAFGLLVCSRAHGISRTAMVPEVLGAQGSRSGPAGPRGSGPGRSQVSEAGGGYGSGPGGPHGSGPTEPHGGPGSVRAGGSPGGPGSVGAGRSPGGPGSVGAGRSPGGPSSSWPGGPQDGRSRPRSTGAHDGPAGGVPADPGPPGHETSAGTPAGQDLVAVNGRMARVAALGGTAGALLGVALDRLLGGGAVLWAAALTFTVGTALALSLPAVRSRRDRVPGRRRPLVADPGSNPAAGRHPGGGVPGSPRDRVAGPYPDAPGRFPDPAPGRVPDPASGRFPDAVPGRVPNPASGRFPDAVLARFPDGVPGRVQDPVPADAVSGRFPGAVSGRHRDPLDRRAARLARPPGRVRLARTANTCVRAVGGFTLFLLAFELRRQGVGTAGLGLLLAAVGVGGVVGAFLLPRAARLVREDGLLAGGLLLCGTTAWLLAGRVGVESAAAGGLAMGAGIAAARLGFESLVQRDVPPSARGTAITRAETTFQLAWVAGAVLPVAFPLPITPSLLTAALVCLVAATTYTVGLLRQRRGRERRARTAGPTSVH
jgi:hypothetical protein